MSSIRNRTIARRAADRRGATRPGLTRGAVALLALAGLAPGLGGCALPSKPIVDRANDPVGQDEVMTRRQWPEQQALFANSSLEAYKNRFPYDYERANEMSYRSAVVTGPLLFVGQALAFPFTFIKYPPGTKQTYTTVEYEPTYTAVPDRVDQAPDVERIPMTDRDGVRPPATGTGPAPMQGGSGIAPSTPEPAPRPVPEPGPPATPAPVPGLQRDPNAPPPTPPTTPPAPPEQQPAPPPPPAPDAGVPRPGVTPNPNRSPEPRPVPTPPRPSPRPDLPPAPERRPLPGPPPQPIPTPPSEQPGERNK